MCNINHPKFPCKICAKIVHDKDKAVQCDLCELWIHIKCNSLNYLDYRYLQNCDESWYCIECSNTIFFFNSFPTGTPRQIDVDSTWILRRYVEDQISMNFHVDSTYFFEVISMVEISTSIPRTFST